jgi:hypothetical protein
MSMETFATLESDTSTRTTASISQPLFPMDTTNPRCHHPHPSLNFSLPGSISTNLIDFGAEEAPPWDAKARDVNSECRRWAFVSWLKHGSRRVTRKKS